MTTMAGASYPIANYLTPVPNTTQNSTKQSLQSSISTQSPSKLTKRRNHLRPKILRTLNKPYQNPLPPHQPPKNPVIPIEPIEPLIETTGQKLSDPESNNPNYDSFVEEFSASSGGNEGNLVEVEVEVGEGAKVGLGSSSARTFIGFGLCIFGLVIFRTIWAVWILGSDKKERILGNEDQLRDLRLGLHGNDFRGKFGIRNGGFVTVDERELEGKIEEIRRMAREAREIEGKKLEEIDGDLKEMSGADDSDDIEGDGSRIDGILKEIDERVSKLRKRLNSRRESPPLLKVEEAGKKGKKNSLDEREGNTMLMFRKKYKFRSPTTVPRDKPKGFQGSTNGGGGLGGKQASRNVKYPLGGNGEAARDVGSLDQDQKGDELKTSLRGSTSMLPDDDNRKKPATEKSSSLKDLKRISENHNGGMKLEEGMGENVKPHTGVVQDSSGGKSLDEEAKAREHDNRENEDSQRKLNELQNTTRSKSHAASQRNGRSRGGQLRSQASIGSGKDKQLNGQSDLWWLNLPYVLAILMQEGSENEPWRGFYTLKIESEAPKRTQTSYTVAFEDRVDATNFCYILESFFEDLPNTKADIIPLSVKELGEAVQLQLLKVIVVRKGQLQLYAGQPLADVEMALRELAK
ncbi:hypothetical protein Ancab_030583 [Ancistrocladus abbreviatus]